MFGGEVQETKGWNTRFWNFGSKISVARTDYGLFKFFTRDPAY